jgi:hypothetical protein
MDYVRFSRISIRIRFGANTVWCIVIVIIVIVIASDSFPVSISISTVVKRLRFDPKATLHHVPSLIKRTASSMRF